jgi:hypothetical protein
MDDPWEWRVVAISSLRKQTSRTGTGFVSPPSRDWVVPGVGPWVDARESTSYSTVCLPVRIHLTSSKNCSVKKQHTKPRVFFNTQVDGRRGRGLG